MKAISWPTADGRIAGRISRLGRFALRLSWPYRPEWLDAAWAVFSAVNLVAIFAFAGWETIPFHFIWISFTLLYGFRTWAPRPTLWVLGAVMATTAAAIAVDVTRGAEPAAELTEVPLMAAMFLAMVWHARRKLAAEQDSRLVGEENARLLATQRRFLQDASHQLRTPITIALGHAELLAHGLTDRQEAHDIEVILGELNRLRRIAERLLVIAAAEGPEFLHPEPVALDSFTMEILRRWRPTADRSWQLGRLDKAIVPADLERLGLAIDALLENAVRHTGDGDVIKLSVVATGHGLPVRILVADAGQGIPAELLGDIFDRFRSGDAGHPRGTGLGLALVRAVARAHGGEVLVSSHPGQGSEFELLLPRAAEPQALPPQALSPEVPAPAAAAGGRLARKSLRRGGVHREAHGGAPGSRAADHRAGNRQNRVKQIMAERTWADAISDLLRSAVRHKVISAVVVLCAAGSLTGIALASSASGQAAQPAKVAAAAFSLPVLGHSGQQVSLADYQGKPLIVNFFASWCEPCQQETPLLASFYRTEKGTVALVGLDENDIVSNAMSFTRARGVTYPVGWDPHAIAASGYGVDGLPQTFFLDARHRIVDHIFGAVTAKELSQGVALATASSS